MSIIAEEDLTRVTVISSTRRVDLALPGAVSLSELLPNILRFSGLESNNPTDAVQTWVLQRFGSDPFDLYSPVSKLGIRDGETLHLRPREAAMPDAAFDDVVDAVAGATNSRPSWAARHSRTTGLILMLTMLVGLPLLALLANVNVDVNDYLIDPAVRLPLILSIIVTGFFSVAAGIGSIALARAAREKPTATCLAWGSVALAGLTGWFTADVLHEPGEQIPLSVHLILASAMALVAAAACALAARVHPMPLLTAALTALFTLGGSGCMIVFRGREVEVAAILMTLLAMLTTMLPTLSYRIAGIALPNLPVTTEAMLADETPVQSDIVRRALLADELLGAMLMAASLTAVLGAMLVLTAGSVWTTLLVLCIGLAFLLRARAFVGRTQRLALLLGGAVIVLVALLALAWTYADSAVGLAAIFTSCLLLTYIFAHYSASTFNKVLSPTWGRWGDIFEWLTIIGIVPSLLGVLNLYHYFGTLF